MLIILGRLGKIGSIKDDPLIYVAPAGYQMLLGSDGKQLLGFDGAPLYGRILNG